MVTLFIWSLFNLVRLMSSSKYNLWYFSSEGRTCEETRMPNFWSLHTAIYGLAVINQIFILLIFILQVWEWVAMCYIIITQRNRDLGQILYEFNTEVDSFSGITYQRNERWLAKCMLVITSCAIGYQIFAGVRLM